MQLCVWVIIYIYLFENILSGTHALQNWATLRALSEQAKQVPARRRINFSCFASFQSELLFECAPAFVLFIFGVYFYELTTMECTFKLL